MLCGIVIKVFDMSNKTWLWFLLVIVLAVASYFVFGNFGEKPMGDDTQETLDQDTVDTEIGLEANDIV